MFIYIYIIAMFIICTLNSTCILVLHKFFKYQTELKPILLIGHVKLVFFLQTYMRINKKKFFLNKLQSKRRSLQSKMIVE
jgi:hypothetical protein